MKVLRQALLAWYDTQGRHLPWRKRFPELADPYHVWLSEVMLQQTTVATVIPYFQRFLDRWPTLGDFANTSVDEILTQWQGLGYYTRARQAWLCAQKVSQGSAGTFPCEVTALRQLPGIGDYTAAAIASIAFNQPVVPVDGNVIRVLSRLYALKTPLPALKDQVRDKAEGLAHPDRASDFSQALMDLGATICKPKNPLCLACPWQQDCQARQQGCIDACPAPKEKKEIPTRHAQAWVLKDAQDRLWLQKKQEKGVLHGLYHPWLSSFQEAPVEEGVISPWQDHVSGLTAVGSIRHVFTHFRLEVTVFQGRVFDENPPNLQGVWVDSDSLGDYALSTLAKKLIKGGA
jgi:A/G-specific adenine glycosylase